GILLVDCGDRVPVFGNRSVLFFDRCTGVNAGIHARPDADAHRIASLFPAARVPAGRIRGRTVSRDREDTGQSRLDHLSPDGPEEKLVSRVLDGSTRPKGRHNRLGCPLAVLDAAAEIGVFIRRECRSRTWRSDHRRPAAGTLAGAPASVVPEGSFIRSARELEVPTSFTEWATATRGSSACYPAPAGRINYWTRATWRTGNIAAELRFIVILEVPPRLSMSTMI